MRYIFFHSLFDERKCAQRFSFELKEAFKRVGETLERPDYHGTGEDLGEFSELDLNTLRADVDRIVSDSECTLIGLRFGATLIVDYLLRENSRVKKAVLISPIVCTADFCDHVLRKQKIKDIMTGCKLDEEKDYINIEGYRTKASFIQQLQEYGNVKINNVTDIPLAIISDDNIDIKGCNTIIHNYEPFWERIPAQNFNSITEKIVKTANLA